MPHLSIKNHLKFDLLVIYLSEAEQRFISVERSRQYFSNETEFLDDGISISENVGFPEEHAIAFSNVSFSYSDQSQLQSQSQSNNPKGHQDEDTDLVHYALKNVSFQIRKGEKVAFVGR